MLKNRFVHYFFYVLCVIIVLFLTGVLFCRPSLSETNLIELGRLFTNSNSASTLLSTEDVTLPPLCYLGSLGYYLIYKSFGSLGIHAACLFAFLLATIACYEWLRINGWFSKFGTVLLALSIWTIPIFFHNLIDANIAIVIMAFAWTIIALIDIPSENFLLLRLIIASILATITVFINPSALLLFPLYIVCAFERRILIGDRVTYILRVAPILILVAFVTAILIILPFGIRFGTILSRTLNDLYLPATTISLSTIFQNQLNDFIMIALQHLPIIILLPIGCFIIRKNRPILSLTIFLVTLGVFLINQNIFNNVYLYPYFIFLFIYSFYPIANKFPGYIALYLAIVLIYNLGTGPFLFPYRLANEIKAQNNYSKTLETTFSDKQISILSCDYNVDLIAIQKGWNVWGYKDIKLLEKDPHQLLEKVDYILTPTNVTNKFNTFDFTFYRLLSHPLVTENNTLDAEQILTKNRYFRITFEYVSTLTFEDTYPSLKIYRKRKW